MELPVAENHITKVMVLINDVKYACQRCIRGHRVSRCSHLNKSLIMVKRKGRPTTQKPGSNKVDGFRKSEDHSNDGLQRTNNSPSSYNGVSSGFTPKAVLSVEEISRLVTDPSVRITLPPRSNHGNISKMNDVPKSCISPTHMAAQYNTHVVPPTYLYGQYPMADTPEDMRRLSRNSGQEVCTSFPCVPNTYDGLYDPSGETAPEGTVVLPRPIFHVERPRQRVQNWANEMATEPDLHSQIPPSGQIGRSSQGGDLNREMISPVDRNIDLHKVHNQRTYSVSTDSYDLSPDEQISNGKLAERMQLDVDSSRHDDSTRNSSTNSSMNSMNSSMNNSMNNSTNSNIGGYISNITAGPLDMAKPGGRGPIFPSHLGNSGSIDNAERAHGAGTLSCINIVCGPDGVGTPRNPEIKEKAKGRDSPSVFIPNWQVYGISHLSIPEQQRFWYEIAQVQARIGGINVENLMDMYEEFFQFPHISTLY